MNELLREIGVAFSPAWVAGVIIALGRILLIFTAAALVNAIVGRLIRAMRSNVMAVMLRRGGGATAFELEQRADTIANIVSRTVRVAVWTIALVMSLREVGFDVAPILAGAGIVGLAVGFGAQNLVRDVISGLFMLIENQLSVGDVVVINGTGGLVEQVNLRTTVLRALDGTVHVFPNGAITTMSNMTSEFSYYVFDVRVSYREDTDRVAGILRRVGTEVQQDPELGSFMLEPLEVIGVDQFGESVVIVKARVKTLPGKQWSVGREMNRRIKQAFDRAGVETPYPQLNISMGDVGLRTPMSDDVRSELKAIVREVLDERAAGQA
jgi:small-conductance mechanosensitive channel